MALWTPLKSISLRFLREPLVHFIIAGLVLFMATRMYHTETIHYRIVVTRAHISELANQYALKFGNQPDAQTLSELVKQDVHDEILYRQGLDLKLDQDDEIVRRRIVQKMQFLMQDLSAPPEPDDAQLKTYFEAHADDYTTPPRATFSHIYFSADKGDAARQRALSVLKTLSNDTDRAPDRGDPFPDLYDFSAYEPLQVERLFGHTPFSKAVFSAPVGKWGGPYRSGYGWHLLYIDVRQEPARPALDTVRSAVRTDYLQAAQDKANKAAFEKLAKKFTVVREDEVTP